MTKNRCVKTTDQVPIFSALVFGIEAPTTGSRETTQKAKLQHRNSCVTTLGTCVFYVGLSRQHCYYTGFVIFSANYKILILVLSFVSFGKQF